MARSSSGAGDPVDVIPAARRARSARSRCTSPARRRPTAAAATTAVEKALADDGRELVATGTPYAVGPGRIVNQSGSPYKVFTPFSKAWHQHGRPAPAARPKRIPWLRDDVRSDPLPEAPDLGSRPARPPRSKRWESFLHDGLTAYDKERDRPDLDTTSRLSAPLKYGEIHPRTILADIAAHSAGRSRAASTYVTELIWREFYADVLWHHPDSAWHDLRPELAKLPYDSGAETDRLVDAWREGRTGYPIVDAGMRQLLAEGWMHNRVRMITASFLTKDLHVWWPVGAQHFLDHLVDGDIASNNHGWQWVAGTGTDASPVLPGLQPGDAGEEVRPRRRVRPALGPGAAAPAGCARPTSRGSTTTGTTRSIPSGRRPRRRAQGDPGPLRARPALRRGGQIRVRGPVAELRAFLDAALLEPVPGRTPTRPSVRTRRRVVVAHHLVVGSVVLAWALRIHRRATRSSTPPRSPSRRSGASARSRRGRCTLGRGHTRSGERETAARRAVPRARRAAARRLPRRRARRRAASRSCASRSTSCSTTRASGRLPVVLAITVGQRRRRGALLPRRALCRPPAPPVALTTVLYALTTVGSGIPLLVARRRHHRPRDRACSDASPAASSGRSSRT